MIKPAVSALALALALAACGQPADKPAAATELTADQKAEISKELNEWFDAKYEESLQESPIMMTFLGRKDLNDKIDCFTLACADEQLARQKAAVEEMKATFNYDDLSDADKLSWDLFEYQYNQAAEAAKFRYNGFVYDQMNGPQGFIPQFLISFHNVENADDMRAYVSRIREAARALNEATDVARESAEHGTHAPKFAYEGVIDQSRKVITGAPFTDGPDSAMLARPSARPSRWRWLESVIR